MRSATTSMAEGQDDGIAGCLAVYVNAESNLRLLPTLTHPLGPPIQARNQFCTDLGSLFCREPARHICQEQLPDWERSDDVQEARPR